MQAKWSTAAFVCLVSVLLSLALRFSPVTVFMGQSGSKLASVATVLSLPDNAEGGSVSSDDAASLSPETVDARLISLGIDPSLGEPAVSDRRACLERVSRPNFWRMHHASHPNAKRVKSWMFVHSKYREQLADVVSSAERAAGGECKKFPALKLAAGKFMKKIARHSTFEDEQLFRFFKEELATRRGEEDEELGKSLETLLNQHAGEEKSRSDTVTKFLVEATAACAADDEGNVEEEKCLVGLENVAGALTTYQEEMLAHLELEEQTLVGRWLGLSTELYGIYRDKYLTFPYSFMY